MERIDYILEYGTAAAACALVERLGAEVAEVAILIELGFLSGREKISPPVFSLIDMQDDLLPKN